jgi:prolyl-tRNA synthetase
VCGLHEEREKTICDAGEDEIYIHDGKKIAINKEVLVDEVLADLGVAMSDLRVAKASEVGNIFNLGTRFSGALDLYYQDEQGQKQSVWMGSYGIGPARVMGVIAEVLADDKGLVWPEAVAPFSLHLLTLAKNKDTDAYKQAEELYSTLTKRGVEVLFDDRL